MGSTLFVLSFPSSTPIPILSHVLLFLSLSFSSSFPFLLSIFSSHTFIPIPLLSLSSHPFFFIPRLSTFLSSFSFFSFPRLHPFIPQLPFLSFSFSVSPRSLSRPSPLGSHLTRVSIELKTEGGCCKLGRGEQRQGEGTRRERARREKGREGGR